MKIRTIELVPRILHAVQYTGNANERHDILTWVSDRTRDGQAVASDEALYIQGVNGTEKVEVGEWILFDLTDQVFTSATDGAIRAFYRDVDVPESPFA